MYSDASRVVLPTPSRDSSPSPTVITAVPMIGNLRYLPVREISWPLPIDVIRTPSIIGVSWSPERVGLSPWTIWRKTGM